MEAIFKKHPNKPSQMKPTYVSMLLACVIFSCNPLKKAPSAESQLPSIAVIGKKDNSLLHTNFKPVGEPHLSKAIALSVRAIPFNKAKFKTYQNLKTQKGENTFVTYVDSQPIKPKYLYFEIKDKIGLKTVLNGNANAEVRSYLTKDTDCQIVSGVSIYIDEMEADSFLLAEGLFLVTDTNGMLRMELINGNQKQYVNLSKNEIFEYDLMGFCWGENKYGKPQIETLHSGGNCPDGTEKDAQKLDDLQSFLKL